ncbi:MAG: type II toxin-antitoxin system VapC family toxin [Allosphingosinicella sp.]
MRLLADTHILLMILKETPDRLPVPLREALADESNEILASAVSLWEIALKWQLGKLPLAMEPAILPMALARLGVPVLPLTPAQAVHSPATMPATKDPFDRMLLAQCELEGLALLTLDRALLDHPLVWPRASA